MRSDDHPILAEAARFVLQPGDPDVKNKFLASFLRLGDNERIAALNTLNEARGADDGVSLRQKAQVESLFRLCRDTHYSLKRQGR